MLDMYLQASMGDNGNHTTATTIDAHGFVSGKEAPGL